MYVIFLSVGAQPLSGLESPLCLNCFLKKQSNKCRTCQRSHCLRTRVLSQSFQKAKV